MMPEIGTKQEFKHAVLAHLPARKLIGYWVTNDPELLGTTKGLCGFRMTATEAIQLCSYYTQQYQQVFHIQPEWRWPLLNGS
jgi:hypothetical protein